MVKMTETRPNPVVVFCATYGMLIAVVCAATGILAMVVTGVVG